MLLAMMNLNKESTASLPQQWVPSSTSPSMKSQQLQSLERSTLMPSAPASAKSKIATEPKSAAGSAEAANVDDLDDDVALTFPQRLMEILDNEENNEIIAWLPHGRGFVIFRKKAFEQRILPKYFNKQSKYSSFTRKLNRWGFVRVTRGAEAGAYYHQLFKRGGHRLVMQMSCQSTNKSSAAALLKATVGAPTLALPIAGANILFPTLALQPQTIQAHQAAALQPHAIASLTTTGQAAGLQQQQQLLQALFQQQALQQEMMRRALVAGGATAVPADLFNPQVQLLRTASGPMAAPGLAAPRILGTPLVLNTATTAGPSPLAAVTSLPAPALAVSHGSAAAVGSPALAAALGNQSLSGSLHGLCRLPSP